MMKCIIVLAILIVLLLSITLCNTQLIPVTTPFFSNCPMLTGAELGNQEMLSIEGLVALALFGIEQPDDPMVRILDYQIVCESAGLFRNTASSVSVIVEFECQTVSCEGSNANTPVNRTEQFQFDCSEILPGRIEYQSFMSPFRRTREPNGSLDTALDDRCGLCIDPRAGLPADPNTNCVACSSACNEGQRRCVGTNSDQCCNWYLNDTCVATCPAPLTGNMNTFDCGCPPLTLENGNISYSDDFLIGSVATFTCDTAGGFILNNPCVNTLECTAERGWVGPELTCQRPEPASTTPPTRQSPLLIAVAVSLALLSLIMFILGMLSGAALLHCCTHSRQSNKTTLNTIRGTSVKTSTISKSLSSGDEAAPVYDELSTIREQETGLDDETTAAVYYYNEASQIKNSPPAYTNNNRPSSSNVETALVPTPEDSLTTNQVAFNLIPNDAYYSSTENLSRLSEDKEMYATRTNEHHTQENRTSTNTQFQNEKNTFFSADSARTISTMDNVAYNSVLTTTYKETHADSEKMIVVVDNIAYNSVPKNEGVVHADSAQSVAVVDNVAYNSVLTSEGARLEDYDYCPPEVSQISTSMPRGKHEEDFKLESNSAYDTTTLTNLNGTASHKQRDDDIIVMKDGEFDVEDNVAYGSFKDTDYNDYVI